jgi:hypothetical protein
MKKETKMCKLVKLWHDINDTSFSGELDFEGIKFFNSKKDYGQYIDGEGIKISLKSHKTFKGMKNTLAHEMLHQAQFQLWSKRAWKKEEPNGYHGETFHEMAIYVVQDFPELNVL